jgi:AcrR family transcriptional regulator
VRARILAAALELLADGGVDAVSTRAVSAAAGVQAPTLYRLFGDKQGLLDAAATQGFRTYLSSKASREPTDDPVQDLRDGWDAHVELGLANPALYVLMYDRTRAGGPTSPAAAAATDVLARHIARIAHAGRLRVPQERAVALLQAAGHGTTLTLIDTPEDRRDPMLSPTAREAIIAAITTDTPAVERPGPVPAAVALAAALPDLETLTAGEQALLGEWLDRVAHGEQNTSAVTRATGASTEPAPWLSRQS